MTNNLKKEITLKVPNIINLSNERIRDEIDKILLAKNYDKCVLMMTKLTLDKYLLINTKYNTLFWAQFFVKWQVRLTRFNMFVDFVNSAVHCRDQFSLLFTTTPRYFSDET